MTYHGADERDDEWRNATLRFAELLLHLDSVRLSVVEPYAVNQALDSRVSECAFASVRVLEARSQLRDEWRRTARTYRIYKGVRV